MSTIKFTAVAMALLILNMPLTFGAINIEMEPYRVHNVTVLKRTVSQIDLIKKSGLIDPYSLKDYATPLDPNEEVVLILKRYKTEYEEGDTTQFIIYKPNSTASIKLLPGKYLIDAQLIRHENVTTLPDRREFCKGISGGNWKMTKSSAISAVSSAGASYLGSAAGLWSFSPMGLYFSVAMLIAQMFFDCIGKKESITIPSVTLNPVMLGGAYLNYTFSAAELDSSNITTFYVFALRKPVTMEDIAMSNNYKELSLRYAYMLKPTD